MKRHWIHYWQFGQHNTHAKWVGTNTRRMRVKRENRWLAAFIFYFFLYIFNSFSPKAVHHTLLRVCGKKTLGWEKMSSSPPKSCTEGGPIHKKKNPSQFFPFFSSGNGSNVCVWWCVLDMHGTHTTCVSQVLGWATGDSWRWRKRTTN